jgi:hypothetical protein
MSKISKSEAHYSKGMSTHHCGPTFEFSQGADPKKYCKFFVSGFPKGTCQKVEGEIERTNWCELWKAKK